MSYYIVMSPHGWGKSRDLGTATLRALCEAYGPTNKVVVYSGLDDKAYVDGMGYVHYNPDKEPTVTTVEGDELKVLAMFAAAETLGDLSKSLGNISDTENTEEAIDLIDRAMCFIDDLGDYENGLLDVLFDKIDATGEAA